MEVIRDQHGLATIVKCRVMTGQLHQMNISYNPREDRLLLRVSSKGGDEFRLWLTRRYTGMLINVLKQELTKYGGEPTLASSDETKKMIKAGAFQQNYEDGNARFPLGESGVLGFRINTGLAGEGVMRLELLPEQGQGISLNLDKTLLYMLHNLIAQGIDQAGWHLLKHTSESINVH
jgi:hypothetical protein